TVSYTYYRDGSRESVTDPAGLVTRYTYDGKNRLASVGVSSSLESEPALTTYAYYPDDLLRTITYPNGVVAAHVYDKPDRLKSPVKGKGAATLLLYLYAYAHTGNRLTEVEANGPVETTTYTYDGLDRLKTVTYPADARFAEGRAVIYGYDTVGNRIRET